jgi:hypothetical protein
MSGRWKAVGLVVGLLLGACGAPAEPSPGPRPGATAPAEEAAASPSPAPMRTRLPTLTPAPLAFRPQPLPEGFRTGDHWLAVRVVRELTTYPPDRYAIWFTDGQRWLGPVPEVGLYITRLERAFWRRAGDGWELCARVAVQPTLGAQEAPMVFCTPAPSGVGPKKEASSASPEASPCPDGRSLCVRWPDGSTRTIRLPRDPFWLDDMRRWKPACVSAGRWVALELAFLHDTGPTKNEVYIVDLQTGRADILISEESRSQLLEIFTRSGLVPEGANYWDATVDEGGCSASDRFLLFQTNGMLLFPLSWVARLEDRVIYPLPGDQAQWVTKLGEGQ